MYDGIHDDFDVIKKHCKKNGNVKFDENAVFELLENLFPVFGSAQAILQIIEMLDAQITRDKDISKDSNLDDDYNSDKSSDTIDSIIEVAVPKKNHPLIDLTNNSPESDDFQIVENTKIIDIKEENTVDFDMKDNSSSESDSELNFYKNFKQVKSEPHSEPFLNYLALIKTRKANEETCIDQNNSNLASNTESHEMLEENNNDPNNNLGEEILNEESTDVRNSYDSFPRITSLEDTNNSILNSDVISSSTSISVPESSKSPGINMQIELTNGAPSPVPGCSKDINRSSYFESSILYDDTIKEDAVCIKEIIPWADSETIHAILEKHKSSSNRKELTLWDLMKNKSDESDASVVKKRKQKDNTNLPSKKILKVEPDYDDSSMDSNALINLNSMNNSSDCSEFSEVQDFEDDQLCQNKNLKTSGGTKKHSIPIKPTKEASNLNEIDNIEKGKPKTPMECDNLINSSNTTTLQTISNSLTIHPVKKERNETVVSSASGSWMLKSINFERPIIRLVNNSFRSPQKNLNESSLHNTELQNDDNINKNLEAQGVVEKAKKDMEDAINFHRAVNFSLKKDYDSRIQDRKGNSSQMIQPAKLIVPNNLEFSPKKIPTTTSCIRPASFNYVNSSSEIKPSVSKVPVIGPFFKNEGINFQKNVDLVGPIKKKNTFYGNDNSLSNEFNPVDIQVNNATNPIRTQIQLQIQKAVANRDRKKAILKDPVLTSVNHKSAKDAIEAIRGDLESSSAKFVPKQNVKRLQSTAMLLNAAMNSAAQPSTSSSDPSSSSKSEEVPDRQIYNKLRSIFPDVKSSYVKKICINSSIIGPYSNKDQLLHGLINHLLSEGHNHTRPKENHLQQQQEPSVASVDEQYEYLSGIFPDADPNYLRNFVEKNLNSQEVIDQFIQEKLEKRDYPTKDQYLAKIKITEQIKQYTTDFKIEKFLELFPDPFKHFEDSKRKCVHQLVAFEFLKSHFNRIRVNIISSEYKNNNFNISLTAKALASIQTYMKTKRANTEIPTEDIPVIQEISFIKNKENIKNYIETLRAKEEETFKLLKATNMLITCQCCFNEECMPSKSAECNEGHIFCFECIIRGSESALADGESQIKCFTDCSSEFSLATLQKILPPTQFSVLLRKKQAAEVMAADVEGLVSCPFCHFASIPPPEDKVFKCLNPECMKETCRQCKEINHVPLKCDEVIKTDKARLLIEEKMTEALIRTCYKCKRAFYKEEGCNKMACPCGALMCYVCDKPIKDYKHFNAQGGENSKLCPLYCDDRLVNAQAVIEVANECKKALLKNNPNLKIDTEKLLPKLPTRTKGPHDDIPNANQLPEHVRRIAGAPQFQL